MPLAEATYLKAINDRIQEIQAIINSVDVENGNLSVSIGPGVNLDAFGRLRVSNPLTVFDSKQVFDNAPLFFDDQQTSGSGTSTTYSAARASTVIGVSNLTAGTRIRQTFQRFNYQSGKSQLILMTGVIRAGATGITKGFGLFDNNNGLWLQSASNVMSFGVRSNVTGSPVDTLHTQANWNMDKFDGTGPSGITLDFTKSQILFIDFEWLGVGGVAFGFVINRIPYYAHIVNNANTLDSVYMSSPNLPIRYFISNNGSGPASTLEHICSTVISEGGQDRNGIVRSVDRGTTTFVTSANTNVFPVIGIRLKAGYLGATVLLRRLSVVCTSNGNLRWVLLLNPTVAGVDAASWQDVSNSAIQFDIARTTSNALTGGFQLASGYITQTSQNAPDINVDLPSTLRIGANIANTPDQLVVGIQSVGGSAETLLAALTYQEVF